jgi:hypothetical protein
MTGAVGAVSVLRACRTDLIGSFARDQYGLVWRVDGYCFVGDELCARLEPYSEDDDTVAVFAF